MAIRNKIASATLACVLGMPLAGISMPALADDAGAFIGGVFATKLLGGMRERNEAEQQQAAAAQQMAAPAAGGPGLIRVQVAPGAYRRARQAGGRRIHHTGRVQSEETGDSRQLVIA